MTSYRVEFTDARGALAAAGAFLAAEPVLHTVLTTMAHALMDAPAVTYPRWFALVFDADQVVGVAMRTAPSAPHPVYVLPMPARAARALGDALRTSGESIAELNGFLPALEHVAAGLGKPPTLRERLRLFELGTPRAPSPPTGALRIATPDDLALVHRWYDDFGLAAAEQAGRSVERHGNGVPVEPLLRQLAAGEVALWEDDGPVHVSAARAPSFGVSRIGPVYTPPRHRGRGYAGATVYALAIRRIAEGARVCLFADQANPTATRLYERLGFRPVAETALVSLTR